jgi:hypothetical protein
VYEVDHPATQKWKGNHLHQLGLEMLPSVTLAPVDFERQRLADGLAGVGFQAECPAFFVWLGVVPYPLREASADDFLRGPKVACQCCYFPLAFSPPAADAYSRIAFIRSVGGAFRLSCSAANQKGPLLKL